jgi:DNA-directed RNA polymerase specialized sigma24 family protein
LAEIVGSKIRAKENWALSQGAFHCLLDWLDEDGASEGEKYLEIRRRLVCYFDRKNCFSPDELADETLNRVARRLEEEGAITDTPPARYCYIVAKFVFLEYVRRAEHKQVSFDSLSGSGYPASRFAAPFHTEDTQCQKERLFDCLERCLQHLGPGAAELICEYYHGERRTKIENRRALAARLGLTINALTIRACRIRDKLEACVSKCHAAE